ncbi:MAG: hypothetical protein JO327_09960, partial [Nitrososphaeraceae archaeon]|nr:hypothetical protein [Nitrososphaeraceae archaeon]
MSNSNNNPQSLTISELIKNFPFASQRNNQEKILHEICNAFNSGCKYIILEAPTGFGKSPVAIAVALSLGSSYICTATKDLQTQYSKDFPYLKVAKGKNNFPCLVKEDFIRNAIYKCGICASSHVNECYHTTVEYGPCMTDKSFEGTGCKYRTFAKDYKIDKMGTKEERIFIENDTKKRYQNEYSQWLPIQNLKEQREEWKPCEYFDQLNKALTAGHSILNYSIFFSLLPRKKSLPERELLVLDEGHLLETEIIKFRGLSISKKRWKRYIHDLKIVDHGYDNVERWIDFLVELETKMLTLTGNSDLIESFSIERKVKYNYPRQREEISRSTNKKKVVPASDLFDSDEEIAQKYNDGVSKELISMLGDELTVDAIRDIERLTRAINNILANPKNWIVSEIIKENYDVVKVELKPLDISS